MLRGLATPLQGRTIFLSDSAVVARRNGDLKFMFRIADIRPRYQVTATIALSCSCVPLWL